MIFNKNTKETSPSNQIPQPTDEKQAEKTVYRLNLALNSDGKNELETLRVKAQKASFVDVIRSALAIYKAIVEQQESGGRVVFRNKDNTEETLRFL